MTKAEESSIKTDMLMQVYYGQLSEKDRRQFAGLESLKMGRGGKSHISKLLGVHRNTIQEGIKELEAGLEASPIPQGRQRRAGGGRKKNGKKPRDKGTSNGTYRKT
jgi:hypothetical protein